MMSADEMAAIWARTAAATPGPWVPFDPDPLYPFPAAIEHQRSFRISTPDDEDPRSGGMKPEDMNIPIATADRESKGDTEAYANRDFICAARTDIPRLLAAYDALVGEINRLRAGIAELRKEHDLVEGYCDYSQMCDGDEHCECGATKHNAAIAALLEGAP